MRDRGTFARRPGRPFVFEFDISEKDALHAVIVTNRRSVYSLNSGPNRSWHVMSLTASQIVELLSLKLHPTCGYMGEAFRSALRVPPANLPDIFWPATAGGRDLGGVLYFLVTAQTQMRMHRIRSDQMYHHYLGAALQVLLLYPDGKFGVRVVGADLTAGQRPQLLVPAGTFHVSRLTPGADYALLATSVWLCAEPSDVDMGDRQKLLSAFPSASREIEDFMAD